jgi:two-component system sensor histidine kinase UhpB
MSGTLKIDPGKVLSGRAEIASAAEVRPVPGVAGADPAGAAPVRILLVEDSPDDAELVLFELRSTPFEIVSKRVDSENGFIDALLMWRPDVILCDYTLPGFDAPQALDILEKTQLDIPFIVVSGAVSEEVMATLQRGATDYLLKRNLTRLPRALENALAQARARDEKLAAEAAYRVADLQRRSILNTLNTRIALLDGSGAILATNREWVLGEWAQPLPEMGSNYLDFVRIAIPPWNVPGESIPERIQAVLNGGGRPFSFEYEDFTGGTRKWYLIHVLPLEDNERGAVVRQDDVTDRMLSHVALQTAIERQSELSRKHIAVQENERRALSLELHDEVGQSLSALKANLLRLADHVPEAQQTALADCLAASEAALSRVHKLSQSLHPHQLEQFGLMEALRWLVDRQTGATGMRIELRAESMPGDLPKFLQTSCFRLAQEALTNVQRHAQAQSASIAVKVSGRLLQLSIKDDGKGFDLATEYDRAASGGSLGLLGMQERAQLAGGQLRIRTHPGQGTTITAIFPLSDEQNPDEKVGAQQVTSAQ